MARCSYTKTHTRCCDTIKALARFPLIRSRACAFVCKLYHMIMTITYWFLYFRYTLAFSSLTPFKFDKHEKSLCLISPF